MKHFLMLLLIAKSAATFSATANIWPSIPFVRGADLCAYKSEYSHTRMEYLQQMTSLASQLMESGAKGSEALSMLSSFNHLHDKNKRMALRHRYIDVSLESSLRAYLDQFYKSYPVIDRKIQFKYMNSARELIDAANNGQRVGHVRDNTFDFVDFIAFGSYSLAPNCRGNISVTLTLVDRDGVTKNYKATSRPDIVMSTIASRMFEDFQRTQFPSVLNLGNKKLTLLGSPNGSVGTTRDPSIAQRTCRAMGGRLPNNRELEDANSFGDWNGGISIGEAVWAISYGGSSRVYHPRLWNPSPVRRVSEVNARSFKYYCVK